jgi:glycosyltransferase involved in cell wall biosynthesis
VKVIHIGDVAGLGGLQNWICSLAEAQANRGFEVELMQPPWVDPTIPVHTKLPVRSWSPKGVSGFDVIHSHGIAGFKNRTIRREVRTPIVHTYYGTVLGIQIALRWFQNLVGWNGLDVPRFILWEAIGGHQSDAVIANSPKVRSEICRFYGVRGPKVTVIPGGYLNEGSNSSRENVRRELGLPPDGFLFLFCGRSDPVKNLPAAIDALRRVRARFPSASLVLAPKQDHNADEGIVGVELPPHRMNELYRCVDALVHPGYYEAYSLAVHEALANGLPVIIGPNTGNADYCSHGINALILPRLRASKLVNALAEAMCSLVESSELRGNLAREAERKFGPMDWGWVEAETAKVYARL